MKRMIRLLPLLALAAIGPLGAGVHQVHVVDRRDVLDGKPMGAAGPYERIVATVHFTVDPALPANRIISDIGLAPRNEAGLVEFSADLYVLKPTDPAKGNGIALLEVPNRGRKLMNQAFNRGTGALDPESPEDFGDRFLLERGYTLVWLGWQFDVARDHGLMRLYTPTATMDGKAIAGLVRSEFVPDAKIFGHTLADRNHIPYKVIDPADPAAQLTVRDRCGSARRTIPRSEWQFAREDHGKPVPDAGSVYLAAGFEPGKIYEVVYRTQNPPLVGLGPAAVRDFASFLKYGHPNGETTLLADQSRFIKQTIGVGTSQSGRFLRTFLYYGFNQDERNRRVFDGVWSHVAGGGRGSFNLRFAQPSRDGHPHFNCLYPTDIFPFADTLQSDPETGLNDGLLLRAAQAGVTPKIFYTNGSYEYWGRAASLIHTTLDGGQDLSPARDTRIYFLSGTQHGAGSFPPRRGEAQNLGNPNDYRWAMRALLVDFTAWVKDGKEPPASQYPLLARDQLIALSAVQFPKIPGASLPRRPQKAFRVDYGPRFRTEGIISQEPPKVGSAFPVLLPQVDRDGNETSGIRLPVLAVPLGTFTGWNLRDPKNGAPEEIFSMQGSYFPFARTKAEREKSRDPRLSIEERYSGRSDYLTKLEAAARQLVSAGLLLESDVRAVVGQGAEYWDGLAQGNLAGR